MTSTCPDHIASIPWKRTMVLTFDTILVSVVLTIGIDRILNGWMVILVVLFDGKSAVVALSMLLLLMMIRMMLAVVHCQRRRRRQRQGL